MSIGVGAFGASVMVGVVTWACCLTLKVKLNVNSSSLGRRRRKEGAAPLARLSGSCSGGSASSYMLPQHCAYLDVFDGGVIGGVALSDISGSGVGVW